MLQEPFRINGKYLGMGLYALTAVLLLIPGVRYVALAPGVILFFAERENLFLRFHAAQAALVSLLTAAMLGLLALLGLIPLLVITVFFHLLYWILIVAAVALLALLAIQAFNGSDYHLPVIGDYAEAFMDRW